MATTDLDTRSRSFSEFTASFAHRFSRVETRRQATSYLRGLLSERRAAGIGDDVASATKNELGRAMLRRAVEAGIPFGRVTADEAYG